MTDNASAQASVLALDVGEQRIGVAKANLIARIAAPLKTLQNSEHIYEEIKQLVAAEQARAVCVGLPRGLNGQHTHQTAAVEAFVRELKNALDIPVYLQDEAVTSRQAEAELQARGKPYAKGDIDALAATYILEDFLREQQELIS